MTSADLILRLGLVPLEGEGGYFVRTHTAPDNGPSWSSIFYLLTDEENGFSSWHTLSLDEQWHFYAGNSVELYLADVQACRFDKYRFGNRIELGEKPQITVPAGIIQGARLISGGEWALLGMTVIPSFRDDCWSSADTGILLSLFPEHKGIIKMLSRGKS